ncbi:hypothetical protein PHISCL_08815 [Aspergillus sclerotialis]|uniref:Calcineurin-like phosphoesterase domain-containing protein n=1 Tax=Aspergillus sclerotialis TaxID=2070753 RepID=A0A3A2ZLT5_9EURO|nr:hypothetical protein PHISCL_08815 [Aspergillus sclerotialis]
MPPNNPAMKDIAYRHPLPSADILLHAGDLTVRSLRHEHITTLNMLKTASAELKLVIPGNHDVSLDKDYYYSEFGFIHRRGQDNNNPAESPDAIKALYTSEEAKRAGIVYLEEEVRTFTLSTGAKFTVYASPFQPEFCRWAFAYERTEDRFNALPSSSGAGGGAKNPVPDFPGVDLMLTHGPPYGVLDRVDWTGENVGCEFLRTAVERARPKLHVFGHIHEGYGAGMMDWGSGNFEMIESDPASVLENRCAYYNASSGDGGKELRVGRETIFANASVVTVRYKPINAPWLVDLDLPLDETAVG